MEVKKCRIQCCMVKNCAFVESESAVFVPKTGLLSNEDLEASCMWLIVADEACFVYRSRSKADWFQGVVRGSQGASQGLRGATAGSPEGRGPSVSGRISG